MKYIRIIDPREDSIPTRIGYAQCFPSLPIEITDQNTNPGPGTKRVLDSEQLIAMRLGSPIKHDTFTYIKPFTDVYEPQPGDVAIGRVVQIQADRWLLHVNGTNFVTLKLDGLNLPGLLRQRETSDETNMRLFLNINELIVVEIKQNSQAFTRNHLFGKLSHGLLVIVPPRLIHGNKHFGHVDDVSVILGSNGAIWLSNRRIPTDNAAHDATSQDFTPENLKLIRALSDFFNKKAQSNQFIDFAVIKDEFSQGKYSIEVQ